MSQSRRQPKGKFKSESFKGTLGCTSSKEDVQGKRELKPDKGAFTERKCFCALSTWVKKKKIQHITRREQGLQWHGWCPRCFLLGWDGCAGSDHSWQLTAPLPFSTMVPDVGVSLDQESGAGIRTSEYSEDLLLFRLKGK